VRKLVECPNKGDRDLAVRYLEGRLAEDEAEAFETHYFGCETCWEEVRRGSELRAALGRPAVVPATLRTAWGWRLFAAAAAILAIAAIGLWKLERPRATPPSQPTLRGAATDLLQVRGEPLPDGRIKISWDAHPEAQVYIVEVLRSDGVTVLKTQTRDPSTLLERTALPQLPRGMSFSVRVHALDPMGEVLAVGALSSLP